ncbi:amino acid permease, partial [Streptomyces scabiei]
AFTWINVLFGEFFGWLAGWALLAEYFISIAFVASGWSAYVQGFIGSFGFKLPISISTGFNPKTGGFIDLFAAFAVLIVGFVLSKG